MHQPSSCEFQRDSNLGWNMIFGSRNTDNLIESMCFFPILIKSASFAMTNVQNQYLSICVLGFPMYKLSQTYKQLFSQTFTIERKGTWLKAYLLWNKVAPHSATCEAQVFETLHTWKVHKGFCTSSNPLWMANALEVKVKTQYHFFFLI